jgi:2-polyprenyl-3-methyl-5-hydroxy-6-metoxy-1,4-benzoquinol methylase
MGAAGGVRRRLRGPAPLPRAEGARELLDDPAPMAELAESLRDVERLNALFAGRRVTLNGVQRLLAEVDPTRPITVLDVGTGSADIPRALVRWARKHRRGVRVIAMDLDASVLQVAAGTTAAYPEISLVRGDALALPVRSESVDIVISALVLHHLEPADAAAFLAEMDGAARIGFVVNDLTRGRLALAAVWIATRLLARSAMSRHDGPLSVKRAYTRDEMRALAEKAGIVDLAVGRHLFWMRQWAVRAKR